MKLSKLYYIFILKFVALFIGVTIFDMQKSFADEQIFGYVQGAEVIPQGGKQIYQWMTYRKARSQGNFSALEYRTELEYGLTNKLQGSLYLNGRSFRTRQSSPMIEDDNGNLSPYYEDRNDRIRMDGVSTAFKYMALSPFKKNKLGNIGLAFYIEPGYSRVFNVTGENVNSGYLETRVIIQKNFLDERLVTALNIDNTFVKRQFISSDNSWNNDYELNIMAGVSYLIRQNWYVGLETRYHSEYPQTQNVDSGSTFPRYGFRQQYVHYIGPNIHYGAKRWWWTLTWLTQMYGDATNNDRADSRLYLVDHEKHEIRFKVSYNIF